MINKAYYRKIKMSGQKQPKMIIMCGYPACGKSTWIKKHKTNNIVVELDWIRREIFGHQFCANSEPFVIAMAKSMVRLLLSQGKNVILDSTALTRGIRYEWIRIAEEFNANVKIIWITTNFDTCMERNKKREDGKIVPDSAMQRMASAFCPPVDGDYTSDWMPNLKTTVKVVKIK